jgi:hypothetical protein
MIRLAPCPCGKERSFDMSHIEQNVPSLFTPPEVQLDMVRAWNAKYGWGFTKDDFARAAAKVPTVPVGKKKRPLAAVTLVPYLPDLPGEAPETSGVYRTFRALTECAAEAHPSLVLTEAVSLADGEKLGFFYGLTHEPGLRFEVIDLGALWDTVEGMSIEDAFDQYLPTFPHASVLASVALHPEWAKAVDGVKVPWVLMPGYEVEERHDPEETVPGIYRAEQGLAFDRTSQTRPDCRYAIPVRLDA